MESEIQRRVHSNIHILCSMKTVLQPCAQIRPKYSNLSAQLHSETDFLFSLRIPQDSAANRVSRKTLIRWVGRWVRYLRFHEFLTVFQSYQGDVRVIMKSCVPWNHVYDWNGLSLERDLNPGPLHQ